MLKLLVVLSSFSCTTEIARFTHKKSSVEFVWAVLKKDTALMSEASARGGDDASITMLSNGTRYLVDDTYGYWVKVITLTNKYKKSYTGYMYFKALEHIRGPIYRVVPPGAALRQKPGSRNKSLLFVTPDREVVVVAVVPDWVHVQRGPGDDWRAGWVYFPHVVLITNSDPGAIVETSSTLQDVQSGDVDTEDSEP
jgi:hypothetical protein